jgi:tetratricopeptide (TPR) repeat protein
MEMTIEERYNEVRTLIASEKVEEAMVKVDEIISQDSSLDMAYYLKGNIYRKQQDWQKAINSYSQAIEINPLSPANDARKMCVEILNFFNTDMYNH